MEIRKHIKDKMTPVERKKALKEHLPYDRIPCVPFMGEFVGPLFKISTWDMWHSSQKMAEAEICAFNRFGHDRVSAGPNSRGITEILGSESIYPEGKIPYFKDALIKDYSQLKKMESINVKKHPRLKPFQESIEILCERAGSVVPVESSIGGPFTIASNLRGVEALLRDCKKAPEEVHRLMRIITDAEKVCIDMAASYGIGIAMADPVANPSLIGPKMYEEFVFPYTKELTDYSWEKTRKKALLHMCGKTYSIWKYLRQYNLGELSLDNIIDLNRAVNELGEYVPLAGNADPVGIMMKGTKPDIEAEVSRCITAGLQAKNGFVLATGCDIPCGTPPENIDTFMNAARAYAHYQ